MLLTKFSGWEDCSALDYFDCYNLFGGNFSSNPATLEYIHEKTDFNHRYLYHINKRKVIDGAVCVWNDKYIANGTAGLISDVMPSLPVAEGELIIPLSEYFAGILPFKAKLLSPIQPGKILNSTFSLNANRSISLFKGADNFSKKTISTMNRKLKKFINAGGELRNNENFSSIDLANIYSELFYMRRRKLVSVSETACFFDKFRPNIFGKVMLINDDPCAFMLNIKNETKNMITIDFINIARNEEHDNLSIGNVLMWANALEAEKQSADKKLRFSFGRPTSDYKERMCVNQKVGRILAL